jgi:hypothetical protein
LAPVRATVAAIPLEHTVKISTLVNAFTTTAAFSQTE